MHIWPRNADAEDWGQNPKKKLHQLSPHPYADFNDDDDDVHHQHV